MSDYDILIKLDPSAAAGGAKKVTDAVAGIENQAKKAEKAIDAVAKQSEQLKKLDFKQVASAGAQAWGILNEKLHLTESAIGKSIDSGVKFAALGAQVAGPWGAAIGATVGVLGDLNEALDGVASRARKLIEADLAAGMDRTTAAIELAAKTARELGAELRALDGLRRSQALAATVPGMLAVQQYNDEIKRQHDLLEKLTGPQREYHANVDSLNAMLKSGTIDQTMFERGLEMLNETHTVAAQVVSRHADAYKSLADARTEYFRNKYGTPDVFNEQQTNAFLGYDPDAAKRGFQKLFDAASSVPSGVSAATSSMADIFTRANEEAKKLDETMDLIAGQAKAASVTIADGLVDAFNGADVSAAEMGKTLLVSFEKAIAQALVLKAITGSISGAPDISGGYGGLLGAIFGGAHATGGSYTAPATGGGPDSIPVMFRMSPRETATFTPHGQAFGGSAGPAAAAPIHLNFSPQVYDDRALLPVLEGPDGQRVIYRAVQRAMGAIRPLGGR